MKIFRLLVAIFLLVSLQLRAQSSQIMNAAELRSDIEKLNVLGSVLYIAAHPDDENTAVLAYLSKGKLYRTAYLSLTRGSGGQNLIGAETGVDVGLIRTQELLQARKIDGAGQFFTRADDFGYSKSVDETFTIWDKEAVLADMVRVIRSFRPDVIISRFPMTGDAGHGHHTASALLAREAFDLAADSTRYPEQLRYVRPWQATRLLWDNWRPPQPGSSTDGAHLIRLDVGSYDPIRGLSYTEIAARSRSMHKSQGFGATGRRGSRFSYFELLAGAPAQVNLFDAIDTGWSRIPGGDRIGSMLDAILPAFRVENPTASIPDLIRVYSLMLELPDSPWLEVKRAELVQIIQSCTGLWLEAIAGDFSATPGSKLEMAVEVVNRCDYPLVLEKVVIPTTTLDTTLHVVLPNNQPVAFKRKIDLATTARFCQPYWLEPDSSLNQDSEMVTSAENPPALSAHLTLSASGVPFTLQTPVLYRWTDRVHGELNRPFEIRPMVTANPTEKVYLFPDRQAREVKINLKSHQPEVSGLLELVLPAGWSATPASVTFVMKNKYEELSRSFWVKPPVQPDQATLKVQARVGGQIFNRALVEIKHDHIPIQTYFPLATARIVKLDLKKAGRKIGYIMGSGDEIPAGLEQLGYEVTILSNAQIENASLAGLDAIVTGIRAFNTNDRIAFQQAKLLEYVEQGGTLVVQYNVSRGLKTNTIGPYPFEISQDRVSVETAPVTILRPEHPLFRFPNVISEKDFDGWIQERGLYFANKWDERYQAILASQDPGEDAKMGGLLYTRYGKGAFIYTGYAWFRQLPAGVPGAVRIFANLLPGGKHNGKN